MTRGARLVSESGIYHIVVRGANKQVIFNDDEDRLRYLITLKRYKNSVGFEVLGWCLMGNHVHLLLRQGNEPISDSMKRLGVSYVWFFNKKYATTGHLFQDRFHSEPVSTEPYLKIVVRYIHQNPVKAGIATSVGSWPWSSCRGYYGQTTTPPGLLDSQYVLRVFADDPRAAMGAFKAFNEAHNDDCCLDMEGSYKGLTDEEARQRLELMLAGISIPQIKSLPKDARDRVLRKAKGIDGISQRQLARLLGVSKNIIFKA